MSKLHQYYKVFILPPSSFGHTCLKNNSGINKAVAGGIREYHIICMCKLRGA